MTDDESMDSADTVWLFLYHCWPFDVIHLPQGSFSLEWNRGVFLFCPSSPRDASLPPCPKHEHVFVRGYPWNAIRGPGTHAEIVHTNIQGNHAHQNVRPMDVAHVRQWAAVVTTPGAAGTMVPRQSVCHVPEKASGRQEGALTKLLLD